jgi:hypothetical protein
MSERTRRNPRKIGALAVGAVLAAIVIVAGHFLTAETPEVDPEAAARAPEPTAQAIEDCNRYAASVTRDSGRIVRDGLVGGAVGAGLGAAGGAIADGGSGAGKGAGIGALVGATAGGLYGLNEENRKTQVARDAYRDCLARRGYRS